MKYLLILLLNVDGNWQPKSFKFDSKYNCLELSSWITKNVSKSVVIEDCSDITIRGGL